MPACLGFQQQLKPKIPALKAATGAVSGPGCIRVFDFGCRLTVVIAVTLVLGIWLFVLGHGVAIGRLGFWRSVFLSFCGLT